MRLQVGRRLKITWLCSLRAALLLSVVAAAAWGSWTAAARAVPPSQDGESRLRYAALAGATLPAGTRIAGEQVRGRLVWLGPAESDFIPSPHLAAGKYVTQCVPSQAVLSERTVRATPLLRPPDGGGVVAVLVKAEQARTLRPGMRLAFARSNTLVPSAKEIAKAGAAAGLRLVALTGAGTGGESKAGGDGKTALLVDVSGCALACAARLATEEWAPVVLAPDGEPDCGRRDRR